MSDVKQEGIGVEYPNEDFHRMAMEILGDIFRGVQTDNMVAFVAPNTEKENSDVKIIHTKFRYPEGVRFSYYGCTGQCTRHTGVIVVASRVDLERRVVFYGVAYCSPKDVYNKEAGKQISYMDLEREMKAVVLVGKKHHKINARILADVVANADARSWAENRLALELANHLFRAFDVEDV
jgi:hypothetical protein